MILRQLFYCFSFMVLVSCSTPGISVSANETSVAPVVEGWKQGASETSDYRVQAGDTVYSIAWAFAMNYRDIIKRNNLREPYYLHEGQILHMSPSEHPSTPEKTVTKPVSTNVAVASTPVSVTKPKPVVPEPVVKPATQEVTPTSHETTSVTKPAPQEATSASYETTPVAHEAVTPQEATAKETGVPKVASKTWLWPTQGKVVREFSGVSGGNKGIDIAGQLGQSIIATATGKVVYTGASLPGYGNLVIIKHNDSDLSAYAFNKTIVVKEGEVVKAGQIIAKMGQNDTGKALLHFEIRAGGKPVNPMPFLNGN